MESVKIAVKLGLGTSFLSSLDLEKEIEMEMVQTIKIQQIKLDQPLFVLNTKECNHSIICTFFYTKLLKLRKMPGTDKRFFKKS